MNPLHPATELETNADNRLFDVEHLKDGLKERSIRGGAITLTAQVARLVVRTGATVVLARLLSPEEFGIVGMVMAIAGFAFLFKDLGLSAAIVQGSHINHAQMSALFWLNALAGVMISLIVAASGPIIAAFYREPRLVPVTAALSICFVFSGLSVQQRALLQRNMRFTALAVVNIVGLASGVVVAIIAALLGAGYWALVGMDVTIPAAGMVCAWVVARWRPGWPRWRTGIRRMLAFGKDLSLYRVVNYFARSVDRMLLGRYFGSDVLGLYGRAYALFLQPMNQIVTPLATVGLPGLSRLNDDPTRYRRYYVHLVGLVAFFSMPLAVFLAVFSKEVIAVLLGSQWTEASRIFLVLATVAVILPAWQTVHLVMLSTGQSGRLLRFGLANSVLVVMSFALGLPWGAVGVAAGYAVAEYLILPAGLWYCLKGSPVRPRDFLRGVARPVAASLAMGAVLAGARYGIPGDHPFLLLPVFFVLGTLTYLLIWTSLPGGRRGLREMVGHIRLLLPARPTLGQVGHGTPNELCT